MKKTAIAHPNIAFIKYWGKKEDELRLPANGSISMNLDGLTTTTTVEFSEAYEKDSIMIDKENLFEEADRVIKHLDRIRALANITTKAKVISENSFPSGTGLSSSASGFAALSVAASYAAGLDISEKELSILARQGSGSACRSIPDGFVEWLDGATSEDSYATTIFPASHWDIVDIVAVVSQEKKEVSTSKGMGGADTSPFFETRQKHMTQKIADMKDAIKNKDFTVFGEITEAEALEMHAIMLTQKISLIYWSVGTLQLMKHVKKWRAGGLECYFTINTGQDIHILCQSKDSGALQGKLKEVPEVTRVLLSRAGMGARVIDTHLF